MGSMLEYVKKRKESLGYADNAQSSPPKKKAKKKAKKKLSYDMRLGIAMSDADADVYMQKKGLNPADYDMEGM